MKIRFFVFYSKKTLPACIILPCFVMVQTGCSGSMSFQHIYFYFSCCCFKLIPPPPSTNLHQHHHHRHPCIEWYSPHSLPGWKTMFFVGGGHPQSQLHHSNVFLVIHHGILSTAATKNPTQRKARLIIYISLSFIFLFTRVFFPFSLFFYSSFFASASAASSALSSITSSPFPALKDWQWKHSPRSWAEGAVPLRPMSAITLSAATAREPSADPSGWSFISLSLCARARLCLFKSWWTGFGHYSPSSLPSLLSGVGNTVF